MNEGELDPQALDHLIEIAKHHELAADRAKIEFEYSIGEEPLTEMRLLRIAQDLGLQVSSKRLSWSQFGKLGQAYPVILVLKSGETLLISGYSEDPETGRDYVFSAQRCPETRQFEHEPIAATDLSRGWKGTIYLFRRTTDEAVASEFGLGWFFKEALKQKVLFTEIILIALMIHATALAVPLFFQITVDKVLVHQSFQTLNVLAVAVVIVLLFQGVFNFLRNYLLAFATSKIDMRTATRTFGHLVRLPLSFFQRSTAGVLTKHMQQTDEIRDFLTGNVLTTALDATALFVFIPLLFLYSWELGLIVVGFSLLIAMVIAGMIRPFYSALMRLYSAEGERQSLLVESIHGISTIKSMALEPRRNRIWDNSSAQSVRTNFKVDKIGTTAESIVQTLEQLMSVVILFVGAHMVFKGDMTVGKLIAFKMLSSNVSQPLIKIVEMIHEYQKARLAVRMLGNIMNARAEGNSSSQTLTPDVSGQIVFENVTFTYDGSDKPALQDVSFSIEAGETIGIVGESGSGKSTLARLVQGLYAVNDGRVKFDGIDLREIDLAHLRRSVGIVLQENFLFRGTIRENIALTVAHAQLEDVRKAAQLAGAAGFIEDLPSGYDTFLEENATNLSGGQRQRLAIARALLRNPKLLVFDEATSALDVESETIIQSNLSKIADGRTMLIIAHRLSTLHDADRILVLDKGRVEAFAPRRELLDEQSPRFSPAFQRMWDIQVKNALGADHA